MYYKGNCLCHNPYRYNKETGEYIYGNKGTTTLRRYADHWVQLDFNAHKWHHITHCPYCGRELFGVDKK